MADIVPIGAPETPEALDFNTAPHVGASPEAALPPPPIRGEDLLDYSDSTAFRKELRDKVLNTMGAAFPISNQQHTLRLTGLNYAGDENYSLAQQKKAIMNKDSLSHKLQGAWELVDNESQKVLSRTSPRTVMNVPYITSRGTYIRNGTEYTLNKQFRLMSGVYSKRTADGRVESQFNVKAGTGSGFRTFMDPKTSIFYVRKGGKKIPLLPILQAMGQTEDAIKGVWGKEICLHSRALMLLIT